MAVSRFWRFGFEVEVLLGDLGLSEFRHAMQDPMDVASHRYCQAVARELSARTGVRWSAPRTAKQSPGYYVLAEYDLDPINFPSDVAAGVELLTPPLPMDEAESIRHSIIDAVGSMGGDANFFETDISASAGWHMNVDAGPKRDLDAERFILGSDELNLLSNQGRLNNRSAAPQRHAYGIPLLRYTLSERRDEILAGTGIINILEGFTGDSKRYAANFDKLDRGYVELRHFSAASFFDGEPLDGLIERCLAAFEISNECRSAEEYRLRMRFEILGNWLTANGSLIDCRVSSGLSMAYGDILFAGQPAARVMINGTADITLLGKGQFSEPLGIRDVLFVDLKEAMALLALDAAELRERGIAKVQLQNSPLSRAIDRLGKELRTSALIMPGALDTGSWWEG